jgi:hypothetical protein
LWRSARQRTSRGPLGVDLPRRPVAGRDDRIAKARQRPDDAAHEEAGDQHHSAQALPRDPARVRVGSSCGLEAWWRQEQPPAFLTGHEADPQTAARSGAAVPQLHRFAELVEQVGGQVDGQSGNAASDVVPRGHRAATAAPARRRRQQRRAAAGLSVETGQDDLQQADLADDQLHRLVDMRVRQNRPKSEKVASSATAMTAITRSTVRPASDAGKQRSFTAAGSPAASGTKT